MSHSEEVAAYKASVDNAYCGIHHWTISEMYAVKKHIYGWVAAVFILVFLGTRKHLLASFSYL
jgi:hypothetical protein